MKRLKIYFSLILLTSLTSYFAFSQDEPFFEEFQVWDYQEDGLYPYQTPDIMVAGSGTVFAFSDARIGRGDGEPSHVVLKRSEDGGHTWSKNIFMARSENGENHLFPCMVEDSESGKLFYFYSTRTFPEADFSYMFFRSSVDDGKCWSKPILVDEIVKDKDKLLQQQLLDNTAPLYFEPTNAPVFGREIVLAGPGGGIQLSKEHPIAPNRLIIPLFLIKDRWGPMADRGYGNAILYSDDRGESWLAGGIVPLGKYHSSEVSIIEMDNGDLLMNARIALDTLTNQKRSISISSDGGMTWTEPVLDSSGIPLSFRTGNGMERLTFAKNDPTGTNRILYSFPNDPARRRNMTVLMSYDEHKTWPVSKLIYDGDFAGYSNMAILPDNKILLIYARGGGGGGWFGSHVYVAKFNVEWLTDGKDSLAGGRNKSK